MGSSLIVAIVVSRSPASSASTWRWNNATIACCSLDKAVICYLALLSGSGFILRARLSANRTAPLQDLLTLTAIYRRITKMYFDDKRPKL